MQVAGPLVVRIGSRRACAACAAGAVLLVVAVNLPGIATDPWYLGAALLALGLGTGAIDVAMNDQAVLVQRAYGRPTMASFHAFFSVGGGVGAVVGACTQMLHLSMHWSLGLGSAIAAKLADSSR